MGLINEFPKLEFDQEQVRQAGKALGGTLIWGDDSAEHIRSVFRIANNWRDSHAYPMRRVRNELMGLLRSAKIKGITAARLKRMQSIRRKLARLPVKLDNMQDLAGCRAILPSINDVKAVVELLRQDVKHEFKNQKDYINDPKEDGYRSHHLIFMFVPDAGEESFAGRQIEIQVRTKLQHSWATAVEAVGMFRGEDMKSGRGDDQWLRLFKLMSAEIGLAEGCETAAQAASRPERLDEIRQLNEELKAHAMLGNIADAVHYTESYIHDPRFKPDYYLIKYDNVQKSVVVQPYSGAISGTRSYDSAEESDNRSGARSVNTVLVEVDKVENLKAAYPSYFGDVQMFRKNLGLILEGRDAEDYILEPQQSVPQKPKERPDYSWLYQYKRWK